MRTIASLVFLLLGSLTVAAQNFNLVGYATLNGGTTGGGSGPTTTVTTASALTTAIKGNNPKIIKISGLISTGSRFSPGANTTIIGVGSNSGITGGGGFTIKDTRNVIIRNLKIVNVVGNDAITVQTSTNVWIDHNEFSSDLTHGFDYYDGQLDIIRGSDFVTVSWNYFHDHWKSSLVGNSDSNGSQDTGKLRVTYHHNYWLREHTRTPAMRFGFAHIYSNFMENVYSQCVHSRSFAQVLVESNVFKNSTEPISTYGKVIPADSPANPEGDYEPDGFAVHRNNDFGTGTINITQVGSFTTPPYSYTLTPTASVATEVKAYAGVGKISA